MVIFHNLFLFPIKNRCIVFWSGKNTPTETKKRFLRKVWFSEEKAYLQKQILSGQTEIFSQNNLWKPQEYLLYCKDSKGSYEKKDWLTRKEDTSKVCPIKRRE